MSADQRWGGPPTPLPPAWPSGPPFGSMHPLPGGLTWPKSSAPGAWGGPPSSWPPSGSAPQPGPPGSGNRLLVGVLIALISAIVVVVGFGGVVLATRSSSGSGGAGTSGPGPTGATTGPTARPPTPGPTASATSSDPPPDPTNRLARNPMLAQQVTTVQCPIGPALPASAKDFPAYFTKLFGCAQQAYAPAMEKAGFTLPAPPLIIFRNSVSTPCGTAGPEQPAFYCPPNQTIYVSTSIFQTSVLRFRLGTFYLAYHEYGHHVQQRNGTIDASYAFGGDQYASMRRVELQADCFSMVQINTLTRYTDADWAELASWRRYASDATHGQTASQLYWLDRGLKSEGRFAACNTWSATDHVS